MPNTNNINANEILTQLDTNGLKTKIAQYPALIVIQKAKVRELRDAYNEAEQDRALAEAELMSAIAEEVNPATGKARFSNAETRQAELLKRKQVDANYLDAAKATKDAEQKLNQSEDELEKLQNEYKSWLFISDLVSNEVAFWAGIAKRDVIREEIGELIKKEQRFWPTEKAS